jgi:alpha-aminoadipate carrier protein LysW
MWRSSRGATDAKDKTNSEKGELKMATVSKRTTVRCIDCEQPINLPFQPVVGQIITCPNCDAELEVINVNPLELDWAFFDLEEGDEDWEWEEDEDEDEDEE